MTKSLLSITVMASILFGCAKPKEIVIPDDVEEIRTLIDGNCPVTVGENWVGLGIDGEQVLQNLSSAEFANIKGLLI